MSNTKWTIYPHNNQLDSYWFKNAVDYTIFLYRYNILFSYRMKKVKHHTKLASYTLLNVQSYTEDLRSNL